MVGKKEAAQPAHKSELPPYKMVAIPDLVPYEANARTHSPEQVIQIANSIKEFGFINPVLIDERNGVIAGHGRILAANHLGMTTVPCVQVEWLTDDQKRAYILADNQLALNAGWDFEVLKCELVGLKSAGFDLAVIGFDPKQLCEILADKVGNVDPDDAPDIAEVAVSALGDVWIMGAHRIVCGDCTDQGVVAKCLNGVTPHLMVTDPPYGVEYDASWRAKVNNDGPESNRAVGKVNNDDRADWREAWALFPGDVAYVWHGPVKGSVVEESLFVCGFQMRALVIWAKQRHTFGRGHYHSAHEPLWYAIKKGRHGHWAGGRKQSTLWQIDNNRSNETGHSTQKPVECMKRPMENNSSPGQAVYEPFSGSGTTIIAAEMLGRSCHAIELNPLYVDIAVKRWQTFTGKDAYRESDGVRFNDAAREVGANA